MNTDDVLLSALPDFSSDELDDIAHGTEHSRRDRVAALQEIARRNGEIDLAKDEAWRRIVDGKRAYVQRAAERRLRRAALSSEATDISRRISEQWQTAVYGDNWDAAVDAYAEVLRLRDRENEVDVELGQKKRRLRVDSSRQAAAAGLRHLRAAKTEEAEALEARQRAWLAEEERRDRADRLPRRRPAYMDDKVRRPPAPPSSERDRNARTALVKRN